MKITREILTHFGWPTVLVKADGRNVLVLDGDDGGKVGSWVVRTKPASMEQQCIDIWRVV